MCSSGQGPWQRTHLDKTTESPRHRVERVERCSVRSDLGDPVSPWFENLCVSVSLWLSSDDHQPPNDRENSSSIARVPLGCILRVPVPVKCACVMIGPLADVRFFH